MANNFVNNPNELNPRHHGLFSLEEFEERRIIKLAPDAFVVFNGGFSERVAVFESGGSAGVPSSKNMSFQGGIQSINVSCSTKPGAGVCSINLSCPTYDGAHETYFLDMPNGTKEVYFTEMMEVRVFAKGRFLKPGEEETKTIEGKKVSGSKGSYPTYYPIFWGFINNVDSNETADQLSVSLDCRDMLGLWDYQKYALNTGVLQANSGFLADDEKRLTIFTKFKDANPWEALYTLFTDTGMDNFAVPVLSGRQDSANDFQYYFSPNRQSQFQAFRLAAMQYMQKKFKMLGRDPGDKGFAKLEMFGLQGMLNLKTGKEVVAESTRKELQDFLNATTNSSALGTDVEVSLETNGGTKRLRLNEANRDSTKLTLDFGLLAKVTPFFDLSKAGQSNITGAESNVMTKLDVARRIADSIDFEFFLDTNGSFVFKPPFFNADTRLSKAYRILSRDLLDGFSESKDSESIINWLTMTGKTSASISDSAEIASTFIDYGSVFSFGLRQSTSTTNLPVDADTLLALAAGEVGIVNARAHTANCSIPLRPELRMGYPVYIDHKDTFYYVKGVSHSFQFGSTARTSLTLEAKRSRVYDYNTDINGPELQRSKIYCLATPSAERVGKALGLHGVTSASTVTDDGATSKKVVSIAVSTDIDNNKDPARMYLENNATISGLRPGDYDVLPVSSAVDQLIAYGPKLFERDPFVATDPSKLGTSTYVSSDGEAQEKTQNSPLTSGQGFYKILSSTEDRKTVENTLLQQFTPFTVPFTNEEGYRHIGAMPYGANLTLRDGTVSSTYFAKISDKESFGNKQIAERLSDIANIDDDVVLGSPLPTVKK